MDPILLLCQVHLDNGLEDLLQNRFVFFPQNSTPECGCTNENYPKPSQWSMFWNLHIWITQPIIQSSSHTPDNQPSLGHSSVVLLWQYSAICTQKIKAGKKYCTYLGTHVTWVSREWSRRCALGSGGGVTWPEKGWRLILWSSGLIHKHLFPRCKEITAYMSGSKFCSLDFPVVH